MRNKLKKRLAAGDKLYGGWLGLADPGVTEVMALAGFDFLIIDQEHGPGSLKDAIDMMRAAAVHDCPTIVRVPWNDPVYIKRILDAGATSLMVPMIENVSEAEAAVAACRYPPQGQRGYAAGAHRCSEFAGIEGYVDTFSDELLLIAQIESEQAADRAQAIGEVDGVDMVFIGINDMAGSIGKLERLHEPEVLTLMQKAEAGIKASGKSMGTVPSGARDTASAYAAGHQMVAGAVDTLLLIQAGRADMKIAAEAMKSA